MNKNRQMVELSKKTDDKRFYITSFPQSKECSTGSRHPTRIVTHLGTGEENNGEKNE